MVSVHDSGIRGSRPGFRGGGPDGSGGSAGRLPPSDEPNLDENPELGVAVRVVLRDVVRGDRCDRCPVSDEPNLDENPDATTTYPPSGRTIMSLNICITMSIIRRSSPNSISK